jgi:hypothetical protein
MSDKIVLGSGKLYVDAISATNGVYSIPEDASIETSAKLLGYIQGGATLEYTPTYYTVKDDLGYVSRRYLTEENVVFRSGILTWNADVLENLCSTASVTTAGQKKTVKIGGIDNYDNQMYLIRFVHEDAVEGNIRITVVGNNTAGFELQFQPDAETVLNAEFECIPGVGSAGVLVVYTEDIPE